MADMASGKRRHGSSDAALTRCWVDPMPNHRKAAIPWEERCLRAGQYESKTTVAVAKQA